MPVVGMNHQAIVGRVPIQLNVMRKTANFSDQRVTIGNDWHNALDAFIHLPIITTLSNFEIWTINALACCGFPVSRRRSGGPRWPRLDSTFDILPRRHGPRTVMEHWCRGLKTTSSGRSTSSRWTSRNSRGGHCLGRVRGRRVVDDRDRAGRGCRHVRRLSGMVEEPVGPGRSGRGGRKRPWGRDRISR